ncbi:MAG TPA: VIT domain-containing protein [Bryobacteraceae bacterium]|jgi:Ca-activated chloride channel family protein
MSTATASWFAPVAARSQAPLRLAMQRLWLTGRISPAGARVVVQHVFRSDEEKPLEAVYAFMLPRDAALRAFRVVGDGFEVHSELRQTDDAVKLYEQGIARGSLAALARQYGDGMVNLTAGNIRPQETVTVYLDVLAGVELRDDGFRFRFPFTLAPAYHPRMKAAAVDGEGEMELPKEFGDVLLPRFRPDASGLHAVGFELSVLHGLPVDEIGSPSHGIRVKQEEAAARVALAAEQDVPNRDLVLDVRFREIAPQVMAGPAETAGRTFAAIVPSTAFGTKTEAPRRIAIVLDRSGSMQGAPIAQARKAIEACLGALTEADSFGMVAFDNDVETMDGTLAAATRENRERARSFLDHVDARGGTELVKGFQAAARMLAGGGDALILTDGQVAGTEEILAQARAAGIRLFCLGIGSASQDRFLTLLARETGGVSRFVTPRERVDLAAVELFASMGRPVASGLKATGNVQPEAPATVFAGSPVLLFGETADDAIEVMWDGGRLNLPLPAGDAQTGELVRLLQGSRLIADWESRYPGEEALAPLERRKQSRVAARLTELSQTYGLASREMSLVAVVTRSGDRPGEIPETRVVPVGMPLDTAFGAYFAGTLQASAAPPMMFASLQGTAGPRHPMAGSPPKARFGLFAMRPHGAPAPPPPSVSAADRLLEIAAMLEPDGGMPGRDSDTRLARTMAALLAFVADGHTLTAGAFRTHVGRLVAYLKSVAEDEPVRRAIEAASTGRAPQGNWTAMALDGGLSMRRVEKALRAVRT